MKYIIKWFVDNPIAVRLLLILILIGGAYGVRDVQKEVFPSIKQHAVEISMSYPGATPKEIEQQVVIPIEEAIAAIPGIFQITSGSSEDVGTITATITEGFDLSPILNQIKIQIDAIDTLPNGVEKLKIAQQDRGEKPEFIYLNLYGGGDLKVLKEIAYQMRDEMSLLKYVAGVRIQGLLFDEMSIEVPEHNLKKYNLTFEEIAEAIRKSSIDLSAGVLQTVDGHYSLQTRAQAYSTDDFDNIVIRSDMNGGLLYLGDVAVVKDGFVETNEQLLLNGHLGLYLIVSLDHERNLFGATENTKEYIKQLQTSLPPDITLNISYELREMFDDRFSLLKDNALGGLILVFILLAIFLRPSLAFWVVFGIVVSFAGTFWLMPTVNVSFNMLSMLGFMIVLGVVVDDAIIVGESIYANQQRMQDPKMAAAAATYSVAKPVILGVLSTLIFVLPMANVPPEVRAQTLPIFFVIFFSLIFSLIESLFILPSHLASIKPNKRVRFLRLESARIRVASLLDVSLKTVYVNSLTRMMNYKRYVIAVFFLVLSLFIAIYESGLIKFSLFPDTPRAFVAVSIKFPEGTSFETMDRVGNDKEKHIVRVKNDPELLTLNHGEPYVTVIQRRIWDNNLRFFVVLTRGSERTISTKLVHEKIESAIGDIPEAQRFAMGFSTWGDPPDIQINLSMHSNNFEDQLAASNDVVRVLKENALLRNVSSDLETGQPELTVTLLPRGRSLGVHASDIAIKLRQAYYGEEVQRISRSKENVKVMLRYPESDRQLLSSLDGIWVPTASGDHVPLEEVASIDINSGAKKINRIDRQRNIVITANAEDGTDARELIENIMAVNLASWQQKHRGFNLSIDGRLKTQKAFGENFNRNMLMATLVVLSLFMIVLRSVFLSFLIVVAIPFGFVGSIIGHLLFQHHLSIYSFLGLLACSGVVVNDNLILLVKIKELQTSGARMQAAVFEACSSRFRAITLTSVTTLVGTAPLLFESSSESQALIPMVLSLSFGVLFSTLVTLFLVPCMFMASGQFMRFVKQKTSLEQCK